MSVEDIIKSQVNDNAIVLYMKGSPDFPQCGFSAKVSDILEQCDVEFFSIDVLDDENIRQGIKAYSQWPTIPQLYIKGEFVGGCDIVTSLYESGELQQIFSQL